MSASSMFCSLSRTLQLTRPALCSDIRHRLDFVKRTFSTTPTLEAVRFVVGKSKFLSPTKLRGKLIDESDNTTLNIDALADSNIQDKTIMFPDENIENKLFNGIKYKDLPVVTIVCAPNNTKFQVDRPSDGERIFYESPSMNGFLNASKRTNVAAQVTGMSCGQKLRNMNLKTVRVRVSGFNAGRIAAVKGIALAGINVVSVQDITFIDWAWSKRAKKPKRRN